MLSGTGVSKGYGIGRVVIIGDKNTDSKATSTGDADAEKSRFMTAVKSFTESNQALAKKLCDTVGKKEGDILLGHNMMLSDPYMQSEIVRHIESGCDAESAVAKVCDSFVEMFASAGDELTRQRTSDVRDIKSRLINILSGKITDDLSAIPKGSVIVARELTPSMTAGINKENIEAIITETGSSTSHTAILARGMEIPAVLGVHDAIKALSDSDMVIVNGSTGEIIDSPDDKTVAEYKAKKEEYIADKTALKKYIGQKTQTADKIEFELFANIGTCDDADVAVKNDAEGIGLFRTEFMFMDRSTPPDEDEQFDTYKKALTAMNGKPVIIRTLDIGGDKEIPYLNVKKEENPFMGFRAIRYCLNDPEFFKHQLKAILRASAYGKLSIMIPLVSSVDELRAVRSMLGDIMGELDKQCIDYDHDIKVGVMIETPSAAIMSDILAKEADFFSIGTNDLVGYILAVDRGNSDVGYLYSTLSPAVLRSIKHIISQAKKAGIHCGMCGEAASDPMMIPLLISFGLDEFSVTPTAVAATRREIARWTKQSADKAADYIMTLDTTADIKKELKKIIYENKQ